MSGMGFRMENDAVARKVRAGPKRSVVQMRKAILAGVAVMLGLSGCSAASGTFIDPGAATQAVALPAIEDLKQRPVLNYQGAVTNLGGTGTIATVDIDVTNTGIFQGDAVVGSVEAKVYGMQEAFLVRAPEKFWTGYGIDGSYSETIDGKLTQIDPDRGINPSEELLPGAYVEALEVALADAQTLDIALPEAIDRDGVSVYPLAVGDGTVHVTTEEPFTVVAVERVLVTLPSGPATLSVDVAGVDRTYVEDLQSELVETVGDWSTVYDNGLSLSLTESDPDFKCDSSDFSCKASTKVTAAFSSGYNLADRVKITMKADIDGGSLGKKKCDKEKSGDIDEKVTVSCTVKFTPSTGEFTIEPNWTVSGVATFKPDVGEWTQALEDEFSAVLAAY